MPVLVPPNPPEDLSVEQEVAAILAEHFPNGLDSPTDAAIARGRAKTIIRDAANDDEAWDDANLA